MFTNTRPTAIVMLDWSESMTMTDTQVIPSHLVCDVIILWVLHVYTLTQIPISQITNRPNDNYQPLADLWQSSQLNTHKSIDLIQVLS